MGGTERQSATGGGGDYYGRRRGQSKAGRKGAVDTRDATCEPQRTYTGLIEGMIWGMVIFLTNPDFFWEGDVYDFKTIFVAHRFLRFRSRANNNIPEEEAAAAKEEEEEEEEEKEEEEE